MQAVTAAASQALTRKSMTCSVCGLEARSRASASSQLPRR